MFAWGNPSRGDDAVGHWFAERFNSRSGTDFVVIEDFQLQVEHLLDCSEGDLLLFVDARCSDGQGVEFTEIRPSPVLGHTSHALAPEELLGQYPKVFANPPPPAFLLSVAGRQFELGQPMTDETRQSCEVGAAIVERLLADQDPGAWRSFCVPCQDVMPRAG